MSTDTILLNSNDAVSLHHPENSTWRTKIARTAISVALASALSLSLLTMAPSIAHAQDEGEPSPSDQPIHAASALEALSHIGSEEFIQDVGDAAAEVARTQDIDALMAVASAQEGAPYAYGGTTPSGFDCSGFVGYCFREALGIELPRTAGAQSSFGEEVSMDDLQRGDLLFWGSRKGVYHVGIYIEDGTYIHAAGRGKGVRIQTMDYFTPTFAKRIL